MKPCEWSGELRSLSAEQGEVRDEPVLATPNEKSGEGSGPGRGEDTGRVENANSWLSGREERMDEWYADIGEGDGDTGTPFGEKRNVRESTEEWRA